ATGGGGTVSGTGAQEGEFPGEPPTGAARLQAEAEPDSLVVSPLTARLAGRSFRYKSLGKRPLRGIEEPMEIFVVRGMRTALNRFRALRARSTAPWWDVARRSSCCSAAGAAPPIRKAISCCCRAMPASASHARGR